MTGWGTLSATVFLHWGVLQISLANFLVILVMIVLFVLALLLPFPHGDDRSAGSGGTDEGH